ncbi:MAG: plastocyanin/azurin family copper-binding protein [Planctomycetaceae bacterium]
MVPILFGAGLIVQPTVFAQQHEHGDVGGDVDHHHHDHGDPPVERPRVFLDKSPRIVEYQLKRLSNAQLLLVERATDDPRYIPVYRAILVRPGLAVGMREEAADALAIMQESSVTDVLLSAVESLDPQNGDEKRVAGQLSQMLLKHPAAELSAMQQRLAQAAVSNNELARVTGMAGLIAAGNLSESNSLAGRDPAARESWLNAVTLIPDNRPLRDSVLPFLDDAQPESIRRAAINAVVAIPENRGDTFQRLAVFVSNPTLRTPAVRGLLKLPKDARDADVANTVVRTLVTFAETTPAAERTSAEFIDAMDLADQLLTEIPPELAKPYRERLRAVTVRVVRIQTVEEEMRYDTTVFAVEAGRPVQIVLFNEDLMPHNFVITRPDTMKDVALAGAALGTNPGLNGQLYVPDTPDVMYAMKMVNAGQHESLTFTAPDEPGEYPYVCTFPRHWMRMYGVMIVVTDLDEWLRNPTIPKDPLGNNRSFVKNWTIDDMPADLTDVLRGRSPEIGAKLFRDATCLGCHKLNSEGGAVGPELTDVLKRWKGDRRGILREILEPSYRIDPKYAVRVVIKLDGTTVSGLLKAEDSNSISLLVNPEVPEPVTINRDDIDEIVQSSVSMMPKALLDKFSQDEIMEILSYITP